MRCEKCGEERVAGHNGICLPCWEYIGCVEKRLKHLMESDFIRSFDAKKPNGEYKRNIKDADITVMEYHANELSRRAEELSAKERNRANEIFIAQVSGMLDTIGSMAGSEITDRLAKSAIAAAETLNGMLEGKGK